MKCIVPFILLILTVFYIIYFIILKYRYIKGDKVYGVVKDYKKYKKYRLYLLKLSNGNVIDYNSNKFYMINTKILLSNYKEKYYSKNKISDILFKIIFLIIITIGLFIYILYK